jgi:tRNA (adenine57-N1/adenine58-N1)-methyltransferase
MEQVLRTVAALNAAGFSGTLRGSSASRPLTVWRTADVTMYEALLRPHDVSAPAPPQRVADVAARLRAQEKRREEKRLVQISQARTRGAGSGAKRKAPDAAVDGAAGEPEVKKARVEPALGDVPAEADAAEPGAPVDDAEQLGTLVVSAAAASGALGLGNASLADTVTMQAAFERTPAAAAGRRWDKVAANGEKMVLSRPFSEVKGHTSYLTFACLVPGTADAASALIAASALVPGAETDALVEGAATTVQNGHDAMVVDQDSA